MEKSKKKKWNFNSKARVLIFCRTSVFIITLDKVHLQIEMDEYFSFLLKNVLWVLITRLTSEYSDKRIFDES